MRVCLCGPNLLKALEDLILHGLLINGANDLIEDLEGFAFYLDLRLLFKDKEYSGQYRLLDCIVIYLLNNNGDFGEG